MHQEVRRSLVQTQLKRWTPTKPIKTLKTGRFLKAGEQKENITNRLLRFWLVVQQYEKRNFHDFSNFFF
ncbi:hypothetical protein B9Z55_014574 [Caenorhabditis nigoni]|uniref:Uncharacterized protein n=1 Tax=Caenorhabditis nigoni TaxID=1611254 RepID=A0A2G5U6Z4_9PELO|nr:hypothetical protein B9Z55_014574 [Caenorhabditis nigoni]